MTFGFNLILALALLAPGFAVYAGFYFGTQLTVIKSPPPPPGSVLSLGFITLGALASHLGGLGLYSLQAAACGTLPCLPVAREPNAYLLLLQSFTAPAAVDGGDLFAMLLFLVGLTTAAFLATAFLVRLALRTDAFQQMVFGWLKQVGFARDEDEIVLCFVLSNVEEGGSIVGYEGIVENITLNNEREILDVTLRDVEMFYLRLTAAGVSRRRRIVRDTPIRFLNLRAAQIQNIAFEKVLFS